MTDYTKDPLFDVVEDRVRSTKTGADIVRGSPQYLLGLTLAELWCAVRAIEAWTQRHAQVLDYVYRHLVLRNLSPDTKSDDVYALYEHLIRVAGEVPRELTEARLTHSVDPAWPERWRAYASIMDARLAVMQAHEYAPPAALVPGHVLTYAHARDILKAIKEEPGVPQHQLGERLGLDPVAIRRIVSLMVAAGLVVRRRIENENALHLGPWSMAAIGQLRLYPRLTHAPRFPRRGKMGETPTPV